MQSTSGERGRRSQWPRWYWIDDAAPVLRTALAQREVREGMQWVDMISAVEEGQFFVYGEVLVRIMLPWFGQRWHREHWPEAGKARPCSTSSIQRCLIRMLTHQSTLWAWWWRWWGKPEGWKEDFFLHRYMGKWTKEGGLVKNSHLLT